MIRAFEGGHVATTEAALGEYVKALALVDRLDNTALLQTLSVRLWPCVGHCAMAPLPHQAITCHSRAFTSGIAWCLQHAQLMLHMCWHKAGCLYAARRQ